jgi:hypothetical protein
MDEVGRKVSVAIAVLTKFATEVHRRNRRVDRIQFGAHSKTPIVERFMPDRVIEKPVLLAFYTLIGSVSGEREHSQ